MDLDQINTRTEELAEKLGAQPPHAESGNVPQWSSDGIRPLLRKRQPVIVVGATFGKLSAAEKDGALASAMVILDLIKTGARRVPLAVSLSLLPAVMVVGFVAGEHGTPPWQVIAAALASYAIGRAVAHMLWFRRVVYRMDHKVAEVMGRPSVDLMLALSLRRPSHPRGVVGIITKLSVPSEAQRAKRLDAIVSAR
ncbi:hypothetical protein ACIRRA_15830 [Nocardia sp. NPDC101769]|uniref:hypothetical protein n=1 Tax=Nocardia sp. NPDC101769 TaxID=3364333 RepID=UPI00382AF0E9